MKTLFQSIKSFLIVSGLLLLGCHSTLPAQAQPTGNKTILHLSMGTGALVIVTVNGNVLPTDSTTETLDADITRYLVPGRNSIQLSWANAARQIDIRVVRVMGQGTPQEIKKAHFGINDDTGASSVTCAFHMSDIPETHS